MRFAALSRFAVATAALCLLSAVMIAQESSQPRRTTNAPPKPSGATPRTAGVRIDSKIGFSGHHPMLEHYRFLHERARLPLRGLTPLAWARHASVTVSGGGEVRSEQGGHEVGTLLCADWCGV